MDIDLLYYMYLKTITRSEEIPSVSLRPIVCTADFDHAFWAKYWGREHHGSGGYYLDRMRVKSFVASVMSGVFEIKLLFALYNFSIHISSH